MLVGGFGLANSPVFRRPDVRSKLAQPAHRIPPALMVAVCSEGRLFHAPGCPYMHQHAGESPVLITAAQATKEGFAPCPRCLKQYLSTEVECPRKPVGPQLAREGEPMLPFGF